MRARPCGLVLRRRLQSAFDIPLESRCSRGLYGRCVPAMLNRVVRCVEEFCFESIISVICISQRNRNTRGEVRKEPGKPTIVTDTCR